MRILASPDRLAGLVVALFGAWFLWQANELGEGPGYAAVGPKVFPIIVGLGLLGSGLALLAAGSRAPTQAADGADAGDEAGLPVDWPTLGGLAGLLAAYVLLFQPLGFLLTSALFLPAGAWVLGNRAHGRAVLAGVLLSVTVYLVFTRLLGLELPAGPLEALLRGTWPTG